MTSSAEATSEGAMALPQPHPALRRLDRLVGSWSMGGHLVRSGETTIPGKASFRWLPGGFFLEQQVELDFLGLRIESLELIGYDPETDTRCRSRCPTRPSTRPSRAHGARTAPSRVAGVPTRARIRP